MTVDGKCRRTTTMRRSNLKSCAMLMLAAGAMSACASAQKKAPIAPRADVAAMTERIWQDRGDTASLDLTYGAGGKAHAPNPTGTFTFVEEDSQGSNPKFSVVDGDGVAWKVKLGPESRPETAATRFLWAAGYFADEDYYLPELTVQRLPTLRRGQQLVSPGGIVHGARLERKSTTVKKVGEWDWFDNPFLGARELNGLRVMMALLNNWDLKMVNNTIYVVDGERRYVVTDVGATFGKSGNKMTRSKGKPEDYARATFIAKIMPDSLDLVLHSRPCFFSAVAVSNYRERTKMEKITRHIPRADAKWLGQRLSGLTDDQIRDGFRAAGYGVAEVESFTRTMRQRIVALGAL
jgi:hypothetical protein